MKTAHFHHFAVLCRHAARIRWAAALACFSLALLPGSASPQISESFDYPAGTDLATQNGGSGWATAWSALPAKANGALYTEDYSLSYPGIASAGQKMRFYGLTGTGTTTTSTRDLATDLVMSNGTHYIWFLAQNLNEGQRYFGVALFNGSSERVLIGQGSTFTNWTLNHVNGITNAAYTNVLVSTVDSSAVALLLLKVELLEGPERVTFWVNPDLSKPEDVTTAVGGASCLTDLDFGKITRVRVGGGGYSATAGGDPTDHYLDEINISTISPFLQPPAVACAVADGKLALSWPSEFLGWVLQTQDGSGTGLNSTWTDVPQSSAMTSTNVTIDASGAPLFFRLRSPN